MANGQAQYEARFFGAFTVLRDGRPLEGPAWRRESVRTLLKWFLLHPGRRWRAAELCEVLWPGENGDRCPNRLHVTLHHLRRLLEPELPCRRPSSFIRSDRGGCYRFDTADRWRTDVAETRRLLRSADAARAADDAAAEIVACRELTAYYERTFLPEDLFTDAFAPVRTAYEREYQDVLSRLLRASLDAGDDFAAASCAATILDIDPYCEEAIAASVQVSLRQGHVLGAMEQLDDFLGTLQRELGTRPPHRLSRIRQRLRSPG
ncbi:AfsR/SARP family transcriptional regulator [Nocardiopsis halophila]|uniref:AfsR/SARP family transcriptional regulator n=1 Tax=Nocardiopsis halophila TaxID=141692 RepID=UPI0003479471|nr:BTAD domain-containing putative transcriptional regulator [Nocardiopsis halophila]